MSEPKFTPGPWHVEKSENDIAIYVIANEKHGYLPICRLFGSMDTVAQDNANLIKAAPEMYAELENMCQKFRNEHTVLPCEWCNIQKVLRKARGESEVSE